MPVYVIVILLLMAMPTSLMAVTSANVKRSVDRVETPNKTAESLILPFAFSTETMGLNLGLGAMASGYFQDQMTVGATAFGGEISYGVGAGLWNFRLPGTDRLYFSIVGMEGYYPDQRAYATTRDEFHTSPLAGSNDSSPDDYIEANGSSNWWEMKLEFSLPFGATANKGMVNYETRNGLLISEPSGGDKWNPLTSGASVVLLRQFNRYQSFEQEERFLDGAVHAVELGLLYDNTDFPVNPSKGSKQYISVSHDAAWLESDHQWTFLEFDASKYYSFGESEHAYQRVLALNFWTGYSSSWAVEYNDEGKQRVANAPPYNEGASLGGFYRMRGYSQNRFHDKAAIYMTAEYRYTLKYNPVEGVKWLRFLKLDWFQLVPFIEAGRVAPEYTANALLNDLKYDGGVSLRSMMAGLVVRADVAVSEEGGSLWFMVDHPF
ncbi:BamA/TamA family outer membrane protein [Alkalimarinus sediminis]|uniref:BamA/TamA family outer membrane protein n=1 Tax=Alkalimarinus sediminis TaxID=1632866 RepID=A0A9E8HFR1_9ALTE|nr:BamA/TamA family outer membrane protein [Alkalimarinus sediminis]UZW73614.1 BamA/TamA family outer membrane protein [Alkalimarinus sediminis]